MFNDRIIFFKNCNCKNAKNITMLVNRRRNSEIMLTKGDFRFRSSLAAPDYDVPRSRLPASSLPSRHNTPVPKTPTPPPPPQTQQIYDVPVSKELPLELDSALEGLQRLQSEASAAIARLLGFVSPVWRTPQRLDATLMDLRLAALRLRTSLHDLAEFAEGNPNRFSIFFYLSVHCNNCLD